MILKVLLLVLLCSAMVALAWTADPADFWVIVGAFAGLTVVIAFAHYNLTKGR